MIAPATSQRSNCALLPWHVSIRLPEHCMREFTACMEAPSCRTNAHPGSARLPTLPPSLLQPLLSLLLLLGGTSGASRTTSQSRSSRAHPAWHATALSHPAAAAVMAMCVKVQELFVRSSWPGPSWICPLTSSTWKPGHPGW